MLPPPGEGASPNQNVPKAKAKRKSKKGKGGEEGAGDQEENPVVKHNKKVSNKITSLSTKLTEVRCIMTQVQNANMCQWLISHFLFGPQGNSFVFGRYLDLHLTHHMVKFYWSRPLKIYGLGWYFTGIKTNI